MKIKSLIDNDLNSYEYLPYNRSESRGERVDKNTNNIVYMYDALKEANVPNFLVLVEDVVANKQHIGDLRLLDTTVTSDLVSAINEVNNHLAATDSSDITDNSVDKPTLGINPHLVQINTNKTAITTNVENIDKNYNDIGDITTLKTDTKTSTVGGINENKTSIDVANANITSVTTNSNTNTANIATNRTDINSNDTDIANLDAKFETLTSAIVDTFDIRGTYQSSGGSVSAATEFVPTLSATTPINVTYMTFTAPNKFTAVQNGNFEALIFGSCKIVGAAKNVECRLYKNNVLVETNSMHADADSSVSLGFSMHASQLQVNDVVDIRFYYAESGTISGLGVTYNIAFATVTAEGVTNSSKLLNDSVAEPTKGINPQLVKADQAATATTVNAASITANTTDIATINASYILSSPTTNAVFGTNDMHIMLNNTDNTDNQLNLSPTDITYIDASKTAKKVQWGNHADNIGDLSTLQTTVKSSLVEAINEQQAAIAEGGGGSGSGPNITFNETLGHVEMSYANYNYDFDWYAMIKFFKETDSDYPHVTLKMTYDHIEVFNQPKELTQIFRPETFWQSKLDVKANQDDLDTLAAKNVYEHELTKMTHALAETTTANIKFYNAANEHVTLQFQNDNITTFFPGKTTTYTPGGSGGVTQDALDKLISVREDTYRSNILLGENNDTITRNMFFELDSNNIAIHVNTLFSFYFLIQYDVLEFFRSDGERFHWYSDEHYQKEFAKRDAKIIKLNQQLDDLDIAHYNLVAKVKAQEATIKDLQATVNKFNKFMKTLQGIV